MADQRTKKPFARKSPMPSGYDWPSLLKRDYIVIIHCTQKMAIKLPGVSATPLAETSPLGSWHAHLYTYDGASACCSATMRAATASSEMGAGRE